MEMVDKIIFNKLLARESVFLPSIGALVLKQSPAKLVDKNRLTPPHWSVTFSKNNDNIISIIDVIAKETNVNSFQALDTYNKWFKATKQGGQYRIQGVGTIHKDFFTVDRSLAILINPLEGKNISIQKKKNNPRTNYSLIAFVCIAIGLGIGYIIFDNIAHKPSEKREIKTIAWQDDKEINSDVIADSSLCDTNTLTTKKELAHTQKINSQSAEKESKQTKKKNSITTYYLAVGIYSTTKNADKFIADLKKESKSLNLTKIPFKKGQILVSAYSSQNYGIIEEHKTRLITRFPGIWVYREVK